MKSNFYKQKTTTIKFSLIPLPKRKQKYWRKKTSKTAKKNKEREKKIEKFLICAHINIILIIIIIIIWLNSNE